MYWVCAGEGEGCCSLPLRPVLCSLASPRVKGVGVTTWPVLEPGSPADTAAHDAPCILTLPHRCHIVPTVLCVLCCAVLCCAQVIMATNRIETFDPALIRPGRIDRKIEFPLPDAKTKRRIFSIHTGQRRCLCLSG